jgi:hypothetical protein
VGKIMTWETWKKRNRNLPKYTAQDGTKGWVSQKVTPTLKHYGYNYEADYDIDCDPRKPMQILKEDFAELIEKSSEVVYYVVVPTGHYAGYYKYLDVYWKPIDDGA